ncbi:MAG: hypothetical protein R3175_08840 [Marinobacter sp.]|uniref:hypothetical protein n=1 Tax=Marinobacter sp. TaxID=50741 RepID=UPI00299EE495|nr:hypothetical protein [Marinobacter sp.]MDX1756150.1 hypothetical protein [Marinobacter sp.]
MAASPFHIAILLIVLAGAPEAFAEWQVSASAVNRDAESGYRETRLTLKRLSGNHRTGHWLASHNYRIFQLPEVDGRAPATNGHVHTLAMGWQRGFGPWQLELAPVLAVSSNVLRNLDTLTARDWRIHGAVVRTYEYGDRGMGYLGIRADSRLGDYLPYPTIQWQRAPGEHLQLALGVPDSVAEWHWHTRSLVRLRLGPDGGNWRVRDQELEHAGRLEQRRWHTSLTLEWQVLKQLRVSLGGSYYFQERWRYRLSDGRTVRQDPADHGALWLGLTVRPQQD